MVPEATRLQPAWLSRPTSPQATMQQKLWGMMQQVMTGKVLHSSTAAYL